MSLLTVVQDVCAAVGVNRPTSVFVNLNANRTMQEMLALANEMAQRIAYDSKVDWTKIRKTITLNGDGAAKFFALPDDYKRMLLTTQVWRSTSALYPMVFFSDPNDWLPRRLQNYADPRGEWTLSDGNIYIAPVMGVGISAFFVYLDKNCINLAAGGVSDVFMNDNDSYRLNERLLKLGIIWQWKAQKGSPYAEDIGTYEDALGIESGSDRPSPIIIGRLPISSTSRIAYPWPTPTGVNVWPP